jgi:hypothetical protein
MGLHGVGLSRMGWEVEWGRMGPHGAHLGVVHKPTGPLWPVELGRTRAHLRIGRLGTDEAAQPACFLLFLSPLIRS